MLKKIAMSSRCSNSNLAPKSQILSGKMIFKQAYFSWGHPVLEKCSLRSHFSRLLFFLSPYFAHIFISRSNTRTYHARPGPRGEARAEVETYQSTSGRF